MMSLFLISAGSFSYLPFILIFLYFTRAKAFLIIMPGKKDREMRKKEGK